MRTHRLIFQLSTGILAVAISCQVSAMNARFLVRGPLKHLTDSDRAAARAEIVNALETGIDGQTYSWSNPKTKASGTVKPTRTFNRDGRRCRAADFTTSAGGERSASTWNLCKTKDGWRIVN